MFEADLSSQGEVFPLLLLALGLRFVQTTPRASRLYCRARVEHLLSPEALRTLCDWLLTEPQFTQLLPDVPELRRLQDDFAREYPLAFLASQRLVLAGGQVILDLLITKDAEALSDGLTVAATLETCRVRRLHDQWKPRVAILGSGLAGCNLAAALATRGARVSVFERSSTPHTGASGNRQGALYIKPALAWSRENRLHVLSYLFAHRFYQRHFAETQSTQQPWSHCGVLHLAQNDRELQRIAQLHAQAIYPQRFIRPLARQEAADMAGAQLDCPAAAMPHGGSLEPAKLCQRLLQHHDLRVLTGQHLNESDWDAVVWAGGHPQANDPLSPSALPLRPIRGQISSIRVKANDSTTLNAMPKQVLSGDGYVMPPLQSEADSTWLTFGASYAVNRLDREISEIEMADNSRQLAKTLPELAARLESTQLHREERAAIRCASTDYMPVVGQALREHLGINEQPDSEIAKTLSGDRRLWFMTAFGSKGLALAPLLAEQLACTILGEPTPLEPDLADGCDPRRWARRAALKGYSPSTGGTG
ncbi:hypothetical protein GCM10022278_40270 [Allohahella marinimesophila]|uniref:FAD dependent oxidoreductase domain-containing protein n=1 Tax=Allohahella marinimesophila TaxID=1054972 RepID=A0ABP7QEE3_9GAMM